MSGFFSQQRYYKILIQCNAFVIVITFNIRRINSKHVSFFFSLRWLKRIEEKKKWWRGWTAFRKTENMLSVGFDSEGKRRLWSVIIHAKKVTYSKCLQCEWWFFTPFFRMVAFSHTNIFNDNKKRINTIRNSLNVIKTYISNTNACSVFRSKSYPNM